MIHQNNLLLLLLLAFCASYAKQSKSVERVAQKHIAASHQRALNEQLSIKNKETLFTQFQIEEYINQVLANLERVVSSAVEEYIARTFMAGIAQSIKELPLLKKWTAQDKFYDKDIIDTHVAYYAAAFIGQEAYAYIFKRTHNERFAATVANQMQSDVMGAMMIPDNLDLEILARFLGKNLCEILEQYMRTYTH